MNALIRKSASTILWNRELRNILMLQRGPTAKFMPNTFVFPGGVVEKTSDTNFPVDITNYGSVSGTKIIPKGDDSDFPLRICSLRELFEETGLLFVADKANSKKEVLSTLTDSGLSKMRNKVREKPSLFKDLFKDFIADVECLIPWSTWLTPATYPMRFNVVFYAINVDQNYDIDLCDKEMFSCFWEKPSHIFAKSKENVILPPPQYYELMRIRLAGDTDLSEMTDSNLICPQIYKTIDEPIKIVNILPGDNLFIDNFEDSEKLKVREISWKDLNMNDPKKI
ncbi:Nucleoside diphosphate-linked moiety X motif 19, mitochondrial [Strongyloides ratti]|uniref:Nucleoside diphosphate-linked moiety X motif 19, mitochondrial n=1 Tax=Strongyloides ratti TaxID=34506 RepID=A0A090LB97_STRRB|nr:Nucleoside diphosphate-linked moiety X motif 19, mitochondrial [Strongyloides ratti]CEF64770.1 Nucleoside diphosphate-linked moiety X motif 19, mitochondrial [Strongyloides ratti]